MGMKAAFQEFPIVRTKRLILRAMDNGDAKDLFKHYGDDEVTRFMNCNSLEQPHEAETLIEQYREAYDKKQAIFWGITLKGEGRIIGTCLLSQFSLGAMGTLNYDLSPQYQNVGLMTEALKEVFAFAFYEMGLHRIQALVHPEDIASIELLEKLDFKNEGYLRKYQYHYGEKNFRNVFIFALLKKDFECESICPP